MSSEEEEKVISHNSCSNCQIKMIMLQDTFPVELTCGHEVCARCILKDLPQENAELICHRCDSS